ncbi:MAG: hypothetical protein AAF433_01125 [Bacteroidota bacterium]
MRIIGEIPHPTLKITVFSTTTRFPVQFEDGDLAQIIRLRKGPQMDNLNDVKTWVDEQLISAIIRTFTEMRQQLLAAHQRKSKKSNTNEDELPNII